MAIWWATEALPVAVTSLLPLALFPLLNVASFQISANPYANKNIYLFLGGFILLLANDPDGPKRIFTLVALIACNDTFAYLTGVLFGKHPLAPKIDTVY